MASRLEQQLLSQLNQRREVHLPVTNLDDASPDRIHTDFFSSDYLSFAHSPGLRSAFLKRLNDAHAILGARSSRVLDGNTADHASLEKRIAEFYGTPALVFSSGYDANIAIFSTLPQAGDVIVYDALVHASVHDGMNASRAREQLYLFEHNSMESLRRVLDTVSQLEQIANGPGTVFVALESIYTMEGNMAPIEEIIEIVDECLPKGVAQIFVDEAHSNGIYGLQGRGIIADLGLQDKIAMRLVTFGKAWAAHGAAVLCSPIVRMYLINHTRSFIYSTAMHRAVVHSIHASLDLFQNGTAEKQISKLFHIMNYTHSRLTKALEQVGPSILHLLPATKPSHYLTPIIPLLSSHTLALASYLADKGYSAFPIVAPAVPKGQERIRICVHAHNTAEDVDDLIAVLLDWAGEVKQTQDGKGSGREIIATRFAVRI